LGLGDKKMSMIKGWKRRKENEKGKTTRWWDNIFSPEASILVHKQPSGIPAKWGITVFTADGKQEISIHDLRGRFNTKKDAITKAVRYMRKHPKG